jgi:hypothetical protein
MCVVGWKKPATMVKKIAVKLETGSSFPVAVNRTRQTGFDQAAPY